MCQNVLLTANWSPALAEGTYKFMPVCLSVIPFISDALFSELARYIFLISCMKLEEYMCSKVTEPVLAKKILFDFFGPKMAQLGPKIGFLDFCEKSNRYI